MNIQDENLNIYSPLPQRKDTRIGLLGMGSPADEWRLAAYRKAGFNPVALAWRDRRQAEQSGQRHGVPKLHDRWEQLLDDVSIEVADVAVPGQQRLAMVKAACARRHIEAILVDTPVGMSFSETTEAVRACEAAGLKLAVNQIMRFDHSVRAAKTLLESGALGQPMVATFELRGNPPWRSQPEKPGWCMLRGVSIHHLDTFRYWFGDPEGIYGSESPIRVGKGSLAERLWVYLLEYKNGLRCVGIDQTWTGAPAQSCAVPAGLSWRIQGIEGMADGKLAWAQDSSSSSTIRYASKGQEHSPSWPESWFPDAFSASMGQLLIALENGGQPGNSGRDHLKTSALLDAGELSAAQFRSVGLDEIERTGGKFLRTASKRPRGFFGNLLPTPERLPEAPVKPSSEAICDFTPHVQQVLALSRKEAERFKHNLVGTEHVLLGLIKLGQGVAVNVLHRLGLDLETLRTEVERQVGVGPEQKMVFGIPYTPRVKKVLAMAAKEAKALNHTYVGTEHLLLGLLREGDGVAARVLKSLNVDFEQTRQEILKELDPNS